MRGRPALPRDQSTPCHPRTFPGEERSLSDFIRPESGGQGSILGGRALTHWTWRRLIAWQSRSWRMTPAVAALMLGGCAGGITSWIPGRSHLHNSNCNPLYCRELDDSITAHKARMAARECLKAISHQQHCSFSDDYVFGFEQAFVDIAQGGWGLTPAVPPRRYWGLCHRTGYGKSEACEWFDGYSAGAERARAVLGDEAVIATSFRCQQCGGQCGGTCDQSGW